MGTFFDKIIDDRIIPEKRKGGLPLKRVHKMTMRCPVFLYPQITQMGADFINPSNSRGLAGNFYPIEFEGFGFNCGESAIIGSGDF
jgi:hypothetical protein